MHEAARTGQQWVRGGDGALFHHLKALEPPFPALVLKPAGRGNAVARDLRRSRAAVFIDVMQVDVEPRSGARWRCYCSSSLGLGYTSEVTRLAESFRPLRRLSYAAATLFVSPREQEYTVALDGAPPEARRLRGVLINSTRHVGGFVALPEASSSDGVVECMELNATYASQTVHNVSAMLGLHLWMPARVTQVRSAEVRWEHGGELMLDGELFQDVVGARMTVLPRALEIRLDRR